MLNIKLLIKCYSYHSIINVELIMLYYQLCINIYNLYILYKYTLAKASYMHVVEHGFNPCPDQ